MSPTQVLPAPQRILVIRLDRLGDVVLSTPVLESLREALPQAFIAMMVRPECQEVIEGNPYLNQVILYDKDAAQRQAPATIKFAFGLRRFKFDTALILHPSNRSHVIPFLAGIPNRVGYGRKLPWLLSCRVPHKKQEGAYHEAQYNLQMLRVFGIESSNPKPFVPVHPQALARVEKWLSDAGVGARDTVVAIHPSASCPSKRWMPDRFAAVAERLVKEKGARICLVAGKRDALYAQAVEQAMPATPIVNFSGKLTVSELAALMRRSRLLISNDSGPVHIAAAVGTPVIDIFGRNQQGLSPKRWGPLGSGHIVLHKEVGCVTCLAHNCDINFLCLTSLTPEEVFSAACLVLQSNA